jgi:hypothetical protein
MSKDVMPLYQISYQNKLTPMQEKTMQCIVDAIKKDLRPPTVRWLVERMNVTSTNTIFCRLTALKKKGWLQDKKGIFLTQKAKMRFGLLFDEYNKVSYTVFKRCVNLVETDVSDMPESMRPGVKKVFGILSDIIDEACCG